MPDNKESGTRQYCVGGDKEPLVVIRFPEEKPQPQDEHVLMYARVSSPKHQENLERQAARLVHYCTSCGY